MSKITTNWACTFCGVTLNKETVNHHTCNEELNMNSKTEEQKLDEDWLLNRLIGRSTSWTDIRKLSGKEREFLLGKAKDMIATLEKI